jgi:hypothetical protein
MTNASAGTNTSTFSIPSNTTTCRQSTIDASGLVWIRILAAPWTDTSGDFASGVAVYQPKIRGMSISDDGRMLHLVGVNGIFSHWVKPDNSCWRRTSIDGTWEEETLNDFQYQVYNPPLNSEANWKVQIGGFITNNTNPGEGSHIWVHHIQVWNMCLSEYDLWNAYQYMAAVTPKRKT